MSKHTVSLEWCAGLWEGEGWVSYKRRRGGSSRDLCAGIANTDLALLAPFVARWGGRVRPRNGTALSRKQIYEWRRECRGAEAFLRDIQPFVIGAKAALVSAAMAHREQKKRYRLRSDTGQFTPMEVA